MGSDAEARTAATAPRIATGDRLASILARGKESDAKPAEPKPDEPPPDEAAPEDPPADDEAKPDAPPEDKPTDEAKPDPAAAAVHAAELEAARAEAVLLRRQLEATGTVTDDDRLGYVDKPLDAVRGFIAARLGVKPDAKEVADELAFLRQELLIDAIGADTLADDRKLQRSQEHTDRRWRLGQQLQAASKETQRATEQRTAAVRLVSSVIDATKADHPYLQLATAFGEDPAQVALDLWVSEVQAGRIKPTGDDAATKDGLNWVVSVEAGWRFEPPAQETGRQVLIVGAGDAGAAEDAEQAADQDLGIERGTGHRVFREGSCHILAALPDIKAGVHA